MGMFPIVVALSCFIFLWGMVNYNSFVAKKRQISLTFEALRVAQIQLGDVIALLLTFSRTRGVSAPDAFLTLPDLTTIQPKAVIEDVIEVANRLLESLLHSPESKQSPELQRISLALDEASANYLNARKRYRAAVNGYNAEANHMPSKIIARLFGFKSVNG
jgi:hypothetical protein